MWLARLTIYALLGYILGQVGYDWRTEIFWCVLGLVVCLQAIARNEGYDEATDLAQAAWQHAKRTLEQAIEREERIQKLIQEHKDTL